MQQATGSGAASLVNRAGGKCLDVPSAGRASGTRLIRWTCSGNANQRWLQAGA